MFRHRFGQFHPVDPRSADPFERPFGAATDADICRLQNTDAGIKHRCGQMPHVRRGVSPRQAGAVPGVASMPVFALHDGQHRVAFGIGIEEFGQFTNRQAMPQRKCVSTDKAFPARIEHRPFDANTADGIGPIEYDHRNIDFTRRFEDEFERADERVKAAADILNVVHDGIEAFQLFLRWLSSFAVQAVNRQPGLFVFAITDFFIFFPSNAMFGAEQ